MNKLRYRLHWLQVGDIIKTGDYCFDFRTIPVEVNYSKQNPIKISINHHPHFRLIKIT
jgi:hypothetical protein